MRPEAARNALELQMLETLVDCAHPLALKFGEAAKAEPDLTRALQFHDAFHRGFLAVRMGIRLSMSLRAGSKPTAANEDRPHTEREPGQDPPDRDPSDRERDRDRDYEPVSLPRFLSTLRGVAADAGRLDPQADALPVLQDLLARADAKLAPAPRPTGGGALLVRPPAPRHRLLTSAAAPPAVGRARPPPLRSG